jgi:hypothetical protein
MKSQLAGWQLLFRGQTLPVVKTLSLFTTYYNYWHSSLIRSRQIMIQPTEIFDRFDEFSHASHRAKNAARTLETMTAVRWHDESPRVC